MQHAEITVNGKIVDGGRRDGMVVVIPPGFGTARVELALGKPYQTWRDGTGTTAMIYRERSG